MGKHAQIFSHGEVRENSPSFGNQTNACPSQNIAAHSVDLATTHQQLAARGKDLTAADPKRGGLTRTIGPEKGVDLTDLECEVDAVQHVDCAVAAPDVV